MRNKVLKKLLMIAMAVTMISGTSIATVYANANPPAEETTTQVVEETATESTEDTEKKEDTGRVTGEGDNSAFSTPGNAQLVDDKENDDTKQFLTIQTKKGNTFYIYNRTCAGERDQSQCKGHEENTQQSACRVGFTVEFGCPRRRKCQFESSEERDGKYHQKSEEQNIEYGIGC